MVKVKSTDKLVFDLEILQIDYSEQRVGELRKEIADKYGVPLKNVEVNFCPIVTNADGERISLTSDVITNIQDPNFQKKLFEEYISNKEELKGTDLEAINAIDNSVNAFIDFDAYRKYKTYRFKYIKWKNFLSYGPDNYVDFTTLKGLVLLNGDPENQSGKTTFAKDLLRFALFGKADKAEKLDNVFNRFLPEETEVMVEVGLVIDDTDYVIRRTVTRPSLKKRTKRSKAHQKVEYFRIVGDSMELIENCEDENTAQTNNVIREAVGEMKDFDLIISATEYNLREILEKGEAERSKLFSKWLGLVTIEKKEEIAKSLYKEKIAPTLQSNRYDKSDLLESIKNAEDTIKADKEEIKRLDEKKEESQKILDGYNKEKTDALSRKKEIKGVSTTDTEESIGNKIKAKLEEYNREKAERDRAQSQVDLYKDATYDEEAHRKKTSEGKEVEGKMGELRGLIMSIKGEIKRTRDLMEQDICPTCGQKIDIAEKQSIIDDKEKSIQDLTDKGLALKKDSERIEKEIAEMLAQKGNVDTREKAKLKVSASNVKMDKIMMEGKELRRQQEELKENKDNIRINSEIDLEVSRIDANIRTENNTRDGFVREIQKYNSDIENLNKSIADNKKIVEVLVEEEKIVRNWQIYQELVSKNGIVKIALRMALPIINNEIARILGDLCDFEVCISVSDENKVRLDFIREGEAFDLGSASSGFEGTMASLAIRTALATLGNMPKPNLLILDEVIGAVGMTNFDNLRKLYERVLDNYDLILHICHESMAEDWHERVVTAVKENNISRITVD